MIIPILQLNKQRQAFSRAVLVVPMFLCGHPFGPGMAGMASPLPQPPRPLYSGSPLLRARGRGLCTPQAWRGQGGCGNPAAAPQVESSVTDLPSLPLSLLSLSFSFPLLSPTSSTPSCPSSFLHSLFPSLPSSHSSGAYWGPLGRWVAYHFCFM